MNIFISYAHENAYIVREYLVDTLRDVGYEPWFDHSLIPGLDWKKQLIDAIKRCQIFIYALTPKSVLSEWCRWEFRQAVDLGKPVIPVILERTENQDLPPALSQIQYVDFTNDSLFASMKLLWRGLKHLEAQVIPREAIPQAPDNPKGTPAHAMPQGKSMPPAISASNLVHMRQLAQLNRVKSPITSVAFSPDRKLLASSLASGIIELWNVGEQSIIATLKNHQQAVESAAFSPNGRLLASGSSDKTIRLWNVRAHREIAVLKGHKDDVHSVAFSPDGKLLASSSSDETVRLWNVKTGQEETVFKDHKNIVFAIAFSPDGKLLASVFDNNILLWDMTYRRCVAKLRGHNDLVLAIAFSPNGQLLASGSGAVAEKGNAVRVWNVNTRQPECTLGGYHGWIASLAFSPDGTLLVSGSGDGNIRFCDVASKQTVANLENHRDTVSSLAFSSDGVLLASASRDSFVRLWGVGKPDIRVAPFVSSNLN